MNPTTNTLWALTVVLSFFMLLFFLATFHLDPMPKRAAWTGVTLSLLTILSVLATYARHRKNQ